MITSATIDKCIGQAEAIIRYYCDIKKIPKEDKDDFRAEGLLGMSHALQRIRDGHSNLKFAVTTYCNSYVKGYLKKHHTRLYEKRKSLSWYQVNQTKDLDDNIDNPFLSYPSVEQQVVAKDYVYKALPQLTKRQYEVVYNKFFEGRGPSESAVLLGYPRRSDISAYLFWAFKKMKKLELNTESGGI